MILKYFGLKSPHINNNCGGPQVVSIYVHYVRQ